MKNLSRFRGWPLLRFVLLELALFFIPLPFVYSAWGYFGQPKDYGIIAFIMLAYAGYFTAANAFLGIGERAWRWTHQQTGSYVEPALVASQPEPNPPSPHEERTSPTYQSSPTIRAVHSLPSPPADFTGRTSEIDELLKGLRTGADAAAGGIITGMGGVGKTALALAVAQRLSNTYPDAQIYLELRGISKAPLSPRQAMTQVIHAFEPAVDMGKATDTEIAASYRSLLQGMPALLLLDNATDAGQVTPLVPPAPCIMIVTSRRNFVLPGLHVLRLDVMSPADACALLAKICPRIKTHADEIAKLCGHLPLALRIAAGALAEHPDIQPKEYADSLGDRRTRIAKLKSESDPELDVRATFEISYELLSPTAQERWRALAVFDGQFDWKAAAEVWALSDATTRQALSDFVRSSIVEYDVEKKQYHLHELLAAYADSLLGGKQRETTSARHAARYLAVANLTSFLYLQGGDHVLQALSLFDREWPNIRAGYDWSIATAKSKAKAAKLCNEFGQAAIYCMEHRLSAHERIEWYMPALAAARQVKDKLGETAHLGNLGNAYIALGDRQNAIQYFEMALRLEREIGHKEGQAKSLGNLGGALMGTGKTEKAIELMSQSLAIHRGIGDLRAQAKDLSNLGAAYRALGDLSTGFALHSQALAIAHTIGDKKTEALCLRNIGADFDSAGLQQRAFAFHKGVLTVARRLGDKTMEGIALAEVGRHFKQTEVNTAITYFEQALATARNSGDKNHEAEYLGNLGAAHAVLGDRDKALDLCRQAHVIECELHGKEGDAEGLARLGLVHHHLGETAEGIACLDQAQTIYSELGDKTAESTVLGLLGDILSEDNSRINEAEDAYKKAIQVDPRNMWTTVDLVWLYRRQDREREAIPFLEAAANVDPTNPGPLLVLASIHRKLGQDKASKTCSEKARSLIAADEWYVLASVESICGNADLAFAHLKRAVEVEGFDREAAWRDWNLRWIHDDPRFAEIVGPRAREQSWPPHRVPF